MNKMIVIGHHFVIGSNRAMYNRLGQVTKAEIDVVCPVRWKSNLFTRYHFQYQPPFDHYFHNIFPLRTHFEGRGSFYFFAVWKFWRLFWKTHYAHIIIAQETWSLALIQTILCKIFSPSRRAQIHVVVNENIKRRRLLGLFEWIVSQFVTRFWGCSRECQRVLEWKHINKPFSLLPFSFDELLYPPTHNRSDFNQQKSRWRIGYMGRLTKEKGILDLVNAIENLKKEGLPVDLTLLGSGELTDLLEKMGITVQAAIPHHLAHRFYQDIDIFVLPSHTGPRWKEQFGRVLVEAQASGVAIIGSDSGAIPEVLSSLSLDERHRFMEQQVSDLANKIKGLMAWHATDSHGFSQMLKRAQKTAHALYSHQAVAQQCAQYLS